MPTRTSPFDQLEAEFARLSAPPLGLCVDGAQLGHGLPTRPIPLVELRALLLRATVSPAGADAALDAVVSRAQDHGSVWLTAAVGVVLPGLRRAAARLSRGYPGEAADVEAEVLAGAVAAIATHVLGQRHVAGRLVNAAAKAAYRLVRSEWGELGRRGEAPVSSAPPRPWGHPDLVLAQAVHLGVLTTAEARLIAVTRLDRVRLLELARDTDQPYERLKKRRLRAEGRLVTWIRTGEVARSRQDMSRQDMSRRDHRWGIEELRVGGDGAGLTRWPPVAPWPSPEGGNAPDREPDPRRPLVQSGPSSERCAS